MYLYLDGVLTIKAKTHTQEQLLAMKQDRHLFSTVYIISQVRDADLPT